jgi:hypothetical protein
VEAASRRCSYRSAGELVEAEGHPKFLNRMLRLTLLAPNIQEKILARNPRLLNWVDFRLSL